MAGGTFIIPVMMYLENKENKKAFIHKIDEMSYSKEILHNDPRFKEQDDRIDSEPKKDFATGMYARLVALSPFIAEAVTPAIHESLQQNIYERAGGLSKGVAKTLGIESEKLMKTGAKEAMKDGSKRFVSNWDFIHNTIGYDVTITFAYSYLHELAYKVLANKKQWHEDHTHGTQEPSPEVVKPTISAQHHHQKRHDMPALDDTKSNWQQKTEYSEQKPHEFLPAESHKAAIASQKEAEHSQQASI